MTLGINPHLHNQRKREMTKEGTGGRRWGGGAVEEGISGGRLLSDTVVVSKGLCPGATAATVLRDGAGWRLRCPTWANKTARKRRRL